MHKLPIAPPCPTASKLALAFACPASVLLSRDCPDKPSAAASWGDLVHRGAAWIYAGQSWIDTPSVSLPDEQSRFERQLRIIEKQYKNDADIAPTVGDWCVEAGYAYNLRTGKIRGPFKREPGQTGDPWEVCGSADLVFRRNDGKLVVRDWKPDDGKTARIADSSTHHQLWFLALCASRIHGFGAGVVVELAFYSERGIWIEATEITTSDLFKFESSLLELGTLLEDYPQPRPGWYCDGLYCPAHASACHASRALAEFTMQTVEPLPAELLRRAAQTPEEARRQYEALRILRKVEPLLEQHVKAYAHARGPIPLSYGVEAFAKVTKGRDDVVDTPEGLAIITNELQAVAKPDVVVLTSDFTEPGTSKPMVLDAWAKLTGKKKGSADAKKFVASLREKGLIVEAAPSIRLEERRVGQKDDEGAEP